ncbi:MAG: transporter [Acidocella sp.]|nr:transporter [Acidocella sp.]
MASDPLPGDSIAPPVNVNIGLIYSQFNDAGTFGALRGSNYTQDTHISTDITVLRYIRTFEIHGVEAGVQMYEPYIGFLGPQQLGVNTLAGPSKAHLSANSGFGQPNLSVFFWPINDPKTGTYVVVAPWISPPISSFNKSDILNPGNNSWVYELEIGARTTLIGTPKTPNLQVEVWGEVYGFGDNNNSAANKPLVTANNFGGAEIQAPSSFAATFHEQPSEEFRIYFPYNFAPAMGAFIAPGFYQSFGGKQTYTLHGIGAKVDSPNRTEESQLRLVGASFINPSTQVMVIGAYDIANHGGPLNRSIELRIAKFF